MPSGSKKRKAAKKKKENKSNNNPNPSSASAHSHGGDDVKHQDDKESDVGEVSSPASQDHHGHQNLLTEGEEEETGKGENISDLPSVEGVKIEVVDEPNIVAEDSVILVEREFKIEDESHQKDGKFEHDDTARKSYDGGSSGSSSSSSSSSDDEPHGIKNSEALADSLSGGQAEAIHSAVSEEAGDTIVENVPSVGSGNISLSGEKAEVDMGSLANDSVGVSIVESVFNENVEEKLSSVEDKVGTSEAIKDAALQQEEAIIPSVENIAATPDQKECVEQETINRLTLSYNAPIATADNGGAVLEKDSGVAEPLLASAPRLVQRTSWKSCCGLFEVFTGSGR